MAHRIVVFSHLLEVRRQALAMPPAMSHEIQSGNMRKAMEIMRESREERGERVEVILRRRAERWTDERKDMVQRLRRLASTFQPSELVSIRRFFLYAWCTTSRYAQEVLPCRFGEAPAADRHSHYTACLVRRALERFGFVAQPSDDEMPAWLVLGCVAELAQAVRMASALVALTSAFDARRHGSKVCVQSLCVARLNEIGRRHAVVRNVARNLLAP